MTVKEHLYKDPEEGEAGGLLLVGTVFIAIGLMYPDFWAPWILVMATWAITMGIADLFPSEQLIWAVRIRVFGWIVFFTLVILDLYFGLSGAPK